MKLLAGGLPFERGERRVGREVRRSTYTQFRHDMLNLDKTVLDEAMANGRQHPEQYVRRLPGAFLFQEDGVFKRVEVLGGGENSRLALVKILLDPPNLLLMDEPTIHLDLDSVDALIEALKQYSGTLVFVSHDVHFIRSLARKVICIRNGHLSVYPGDYDYYQWKHAQEELERPATVGSQLHRVASPRDARQEQKRRQAEERNRQYRRQRQLRDELQQAEQRLEEMQLRHDELVRQLHSPDTYGNGSDIANLNREFADMKSGIEE